MRFWPFGRESDETERTVDYLTQVVTATSRNGVALRGKLIVHFATELPEADAQIALDACSQSLRDLVSRAPTEDEILGEEATLAARVLAGYPSTSEPLRSLEIVALHVVGGVVAAPKSSIPPPPPPRPPAQSASAPTPPPATSRTPISTAQPPRSAPQDSFRRPSSGQMLSVRGSRLLPHGAPIEAAGPVIAPVFRDVSMRFVLGVLRAYDLLVLKRIDIQNNDFDALEALIPSASAATGRFEESRADEFARWEDALGRTTLASLRSEAMTLSFFLLHRELLHLGVEISVATKVLEALAEKLSDKAPLSALARYLVLPEGHVTAELAEVVRRLLPFESTDPSKLPLVLTPLLMYVQDELDLIARQIREAQSP